MAGADSQPKLLLHVCCGPCATAVIERLLPRFDVLCFWYNPNIQPDDEYQRRLAAMRTVATMSGVELVEAERDEAGWEQAIAGLEREPEGGRRCDVCFDYRLRRAAQYAAEHGCTHLATTLTISPHKNRQAINQVGEDQAKTWGLSFVAGDFRKRGGFQRAAELIKEWHLYRQNYCGCRYSWGDQPVVERAQTCTRRAT